MKIGTHHAAESRAKISAARMGQKPTDETRAKQGAARRGKKRPPRSAEWRANLSAAQIKYLVEGGKKQALGCKRSPETRAKSSASRKGKKMSEEQLGKHRLARMGSKNPNWRGGVSCELYGWEWTEELREEVRRRDDYKCQVCGVPQTECERLLSVHHINYNKRDNDPVNLVTLCVLCHTRSNFHRSHWAAVFQAMAIKKSIAELEGQK